MNGKFPYICPAEEKRLRSGMRSVGFVFRCRRPPWAASRTESERRSDCQTVSSRFYSVLGEHTPRRGRGGKVKIRIFPLCGLRRKNMTRSLLIFPDVDTLDIVLLNEAFFYLSVATATRRRRRAEVLLAVSFGRRKSFALYRSLSHRLIIRRERGAGGGEGLPFATVGQLVSLGVSHLCFGQFIFPIVLSYAALLCRRPRGDAFKAHTK